MGSVLELHKITKRFPGVLALDEVSFEIGRGSCHALIGENGANSTVPPDAVMAFGGEAASTS